MLLDDLPDECLSAIFYFVNALDDLCSCHKVNYRWNQLLSQRLPKVRYLTDDPNIEYSLNTIYFKECITLSEIKLLNFLPNLKVVDIRRAAWTKTDFNLTFSGLENVAPSIHGLIYEPSRDKFTLLHIFSALEMFATDLFEPSLVLNLQGANSLKQLFFQSCIMNHFEESVKMGFFQNLTRLHIQSRNYSSSSYSGPVLKSIKTLELCLYSYDGTGPYGGFQFMDSCPSLESAFHFIKTKHLSSINSSLKNPFLQDLVLDHPYHYVSENWTFLKAVAIKYPNLKHLGIRGNYGITDDHIPELIKLLANIVILDLRQSTQLTEKSADYIASYCKQRNRSPIYFYYKPDRQIEEDWPEFSIFHERICQGADFMRNCFLKSFHQLPHLMDTFDDSLTREDD